MTDDSGSSLASVGVRDAWRWNEQADGSPNHPFKCPQRDSFTNLYGSGSTGRRSARCCKLLLLWGTSEVRRGRKSHVEAADLGARDIGLLSSCLEFASLSSPYGSKEDLRSERHEFFLELHPPTAGQSL